jgi:ADP-ribose pyrophosphatase YjhB (NUDIX family)
MLRRVAAIPLDLVATVCAFLSLVVQVWKAWRFSRTYPAKRARPIPKVRVARRQLHFGDTLLALGGPTDSPLISRVRVTQAKDGVDLEERADGLPATAYYRLAENWMVRPMAVGHARANSVFPRSRLPVFRLAVCVVLRVGDSYLLTKRVGGASFPYIWVWPGGHVDVRKDGTMEALEDAASREVKEECGLVVRPSSLRQLAVYHSHDEGNFRSFCIVFFAGEADGDPFADLDPKEVAGAMLLPAEDLKKLVPAKLGGTAETVKGKGARRTAVGLMTGNEEIFVEEVGMAHRFAAAVLSSE